MSGRWNDLYAGEIIPPWDLGGASPLLQAAIQRHVPSGGRVLVPGCGLAHDVEAMAAMGFEVTGLDIAPNAVRRASERLAGTPRVTLTVGDFLDMEADHLGRYDAVAEHTCFCALDPERLEAYVAAARSALRPGGRVVGAFLHFDGAGPPHGTNPTELERLFTQQGGFEVERLEPSDQPFAPAGVPQLVGVFRAV